MDETHPGPGRSGRRIEAAAALLVLLLGAAVRLHALGRFSLGNDEIHEVRWARRSGGEMLEAVRREGVHPPVDYFVQAALDRAGAPEWARRLPSAFAGIVTLALTMFVAGRWFGSAAGIAAGLLLALSPIHVRYSQEVRPYALGLMFLSASVACLEAYRGKPRRRFAAGWFLSVPAAAYTLYFAGLIAALASAALLFAYRHESLRRLWKRLPLVFLGWALLYLPWLPVVFSAARKTPPGIAPERLDRAWTISRLESFGTGDWDVAAVSIGSWAFWLLVAAGIVGARRSRLAAVAAFWLIAGAALQVAILQLRPHYPAPRYLLPSAMAAFLLSAAGVAFARHWKPAFIAALAALALALASDARTLGSYFAEGRPRWDDVAAFLRARVQPGERVIAANSWAFRNLGFYWNAAAPPLERPPAEAAGPAFVVLAVCPMSSEDRAELDTLPLVGEFPFTNHTEIRYVPAGRTLRLQGMCIGDSGDYGMR